MRTADIAAGFFDRQIETLPLAATKDLQFRKLRQMVRYAFANNAAYRRLYEAAGVRPEDLGSLADLARFPIVRKETVVSHYPWGMLSEGLEAKVAKLFLSGGTSGAPLVVAYTHREYAWMVECAARIFPAAGVLPAGVAGSTGGVLGHFLPMGSHVAQALYDGAALSGCRVVPVHFRYEEEEKHLEMIADFGIRALSIAPVGAKGANLQSLLEADRNEIILRQVDTIISVGAPMPPGMKEELQRYGKTVLPAFGSTEIGSIGYRSRHCTLPAGAYHVHADNTLIEIVDDNGDPVPPGTRGYVVATALGEAELEERAMPMIRYLLGDQASLVEGEPCACGRTPIVLVEPKRVLDLSRIQKSCAAKW
jgi:phenylacetate-CoA ligase